MVYDTCMQLLKCVAILLCSAFAATPAAFGATAPAPADGTYTIPQFSFADGESRATRRIHYVTYGIPLRDAAGRTTNAVLILHGTGGATTQFTQPKFAGVLFVPGGELDASKYFIVIPDGIGHGKSSKPSDGLRAKFPRYGYRDMVNAVHQTLVDGLHVDHLRLVMGTSMGGMQTWLWAEMYPSFMDAALPLASLPLQISGRNRVWRRMIIDDIRDDPHYYNGDYRTQPHGLKAALDILMLVGSSPLYWQKIMPTRDAADAYYENYIKTRLPAYDANDLLYQIDSSRDYDPQARLGSIRAPLLALNSEDDQINPPELHIAESLMRVVPRGKFVLLPISDLTRGHATHTLPAVWAGYLEEFLKQTDRH